MPILPLPVFEADADPARRSAVTDEERYAALKPPTSIVVRFGVQRMIGEYSYGGDAKPGCGTKLVSRTHRGTELVEMLTTTCDNSGCSKSISRQELREYIEASGGRDFPFNANGRVLRVATTEDLVRHSALQQERPAMLARCRELVAQAGLPMKVVEAEPILGGELLTFFYMSEKRVDFRELVKELAAEFKTRIEMRQVGARDEARLVADYERCGQHCCCKTFLKVLKPVSMRSAKVQKATLDPLKISGRCGRLMCCLRYEDATYKELKDRLPNKGRRVGTSEGPGVVVDGKILVQLVLVRLEGSEREIAVPVEELLHPDECPAPGAAAREADPFRGMPAAKVEARLRRPPPPPPTEDPGTAERPRKRRRRRRGKDAQQDASRERAAGEAPPSAAGQRPAPAAPGGADGGGQSAAPGRRKRRRRRGRKPRGGGPGDASGDSPGGE
jgi:cell fate regulator YaaT (PSP1 superfamily)